MEACEFCKKPGTTTVTEDGYTATLCGGCADIWWSNKFAEKERADEERAFRSKINR